MILTLFKDNNCSFSIQSRMLIVSTIKMIQKLELKKYHIQCENYPVFVAAVITPLQIKSVHEFHFNCYINGNTIVAFKIVYTFYLPITRIGQNLALT